MTSTYCEYSFFGLEAEKLRSYTWKCVSCSLSKLSLLIEVFVEGVSSKIAYLTRLHLHYDKDSSWKEDKLVENKPGLCILIEDRNGN